MPTKRETEAAHLYSSQADCYYSAEPGEPIFTLLGRDVHAHQAVRKWGRDRLALVDAGLKPESDRKRAAEAMEIADRMEAFAHARVYKNLNALAEGRPDTMVGGLRAGEGAADAFENPLQTAVERCPGCGARKGATHAPFCRA